MEAMVMEWSEPPAQSRSGKWDKVFRELERNPGEWAKLYAGAPRNAYSTAARLRKRSNDFGDGYEFASRKIDEAETGVWGRYNGDGAMGKIDFTHEETNRAPEELPDPL